MRMVLRNVYCKTEKIFISKGMVIIMKKLLSLILTAAMLVCSAALFSSCEKKDDDSAADKIIVQTNAYFAPFEYFDGTDIKGVDVDIMNKVAEKLGKSVEFVNVDFSVIIDNVSAGQVCDCGAAGLTVTDERREKVDFSTPYYTSVQYVIYSADDDSVETVNDEYILWDALAGKTIGTQIDTTGAIYTDGEINATADDPDYGYDGALNGTGAELKTFDNAQLAADAIGANQIDVVVVDELPAKYIAEKNSSLKCLPLYYAGGEDGEDSPTEEQYAICVTKGNTELLEAINAVLADYMKEDDNGTSEVDRLLMKHMGMED